MPEPTITEQITVEPKPKKPAANKLQGNISQTVAFLTGSKTLYNKTLTLCLKGKPIQIIIDSKGNPTVIPPSK